MKKITTRRFSYAVVFLCLLVVLTALAGCRPNESKTTYSQEEVCKNLVLFNTSFNQLQNMKDEATPNELAAQWDVVRRNFGNLIQSAANLESVKLTTLQATVDQLGQAYDDLPDDASVADALTSLDDELKEVAGAVQELGKDLSCNLVE